MNEKIAKVKKSIKSHFPEIIIATTTAVGFIAYCAYVINTTGEEAVMIRFPDKEALAAYKDGSMKTYTTENEDYIYTIISKEN
jgi:hypothetical protein